MSLCRVSTVVASASNVRSYGTATVFGVLLPKVDYHKDVANTKFVSKMNFNPYAPDFMENLKQRSLRASGQTSDVSNGYQYHAHTGSLICSDSAACKQW